MKFSIEGLVCEDVAADGATELDVVEVIQTDAAVSQSMSDLDEHVEQGEKIAETVSNIQHTVQLLSTESLTQGVFAFLNADGGLATILGGEVTWTQETANELKTATVEALGEQLKEAKDAVVRWFKKLWAWITQLFQRVTDMFRNNETILKRQLALVKTGTFTGDADTMKVRGAPIVRLTAILDSFAQGKVGDVAANFDNMDDTLIEKSTRALTEMISSSNDEISIKTIGWSNKEKVIELLKAALAAQSKFSGGFMAKVKESIKKAETKAVKAAGDDKKAADEARNHASNAVKLCNNSIKVLKFGVAQAIAASRLYKAA